MLNVFNRYFSSIIVFNLIFKDKLTFEKELLVVEFSRQLSKLQSVREITL